MSYERQNATKRTPAMQAALDKRAARMLRAHEARIEGEMVDATKPDVDASLAMLNEMRKLSVIKPATAKLFGGIKFNNAHVAAKYSFVKGASSKYNAESDGDVVALNIVYGREKQFEPNELMVTTPFISKYWQLYDPKIK